MSWSENFKKLSEVSEVIAGQSPQGKYYNKEGNGLPFYQGKKEFTDKLLGEPTTWTTKTTKEAYEGDILMSVRAPVGPINLCNQTICIGRGLAAIRASDRVNNDYLYYFLLKIEAELIGNTGAVFNSINKTQISNILIPIPPLQEQQQIVSILDEAFEAIDQAKANIEKNITNAQELFQSKLNEIFSQRGEGWEEKTLGEVCFVLNGYAFKSKDTVEESNTQLLRMGNLYKNVLDLNRNPVFYPDSYSELYKEYLLEEGDLIMSLTGTVDKTDYGYTVKVPNKDVNLLLNQRIMKIDVYHSNVLNKDYLKNYLLSPDFLKRLYATASGTRQANLSSRKILDLKINFPVDIMAQKNTVNKFKKLRDSTFEIEFKYKEKLESLEELKKSILQKAFAGELTNREVISLQLAAEPETNY